MLSSHRYKGYPIVEITDPKTHNAAEWRVPWLYREFATQGEARAAIDARLEQIRVDLTSRF